MRLLSVETKVASVSSSSTVVLEQDVQMRLKLFSLVVKLFIVKLSVMCFESFVLPLLTANIATEDMESTGFLHLPDFWRV